MNGAYLTLFEHDMQSKINSIILRQMFYIKLSSMFSFMHKHVQLSVIV